MSFPYELMIVLGGGVGAKGELPFWVVQRLDRAIELYRAGKAPRIVTSGRGTEDGLPEADAMRDYLLEMGIPKDAILTECMSMDTIQNAYFSKVIHVDPMGVNNILVVTSKFHYWRAVDIFEWVFGSNYNISFESASNQGISVENLNKREYTEKKLREFNEQRLFRSIKAGDQKIIHNFIFDPNNRIARAYQKLSKSMRAEMVLYHEKA